MAFTICSWSKHKYTHTHTHTHTHRMTYSVTIFLNFRQTVKKLYKTGAVLSEMERVEGERERDRERERERGRLCAHLW